jgi:hypothetical protein
MKGCWAVRAPWAHLSAQHHKASLLGGGFSMDHLSVQDHQASLVKFSNSWPTAELVNSRQIYFHKKLNK